MPWRIEEIEADWLAGSREALAMPANAVVAAFDTAERVLGHAWVEASRVSPAGNAVRGTSPTIRVTNMGRKLAVLEGIRGDVAKLIERIREGDISAEAELTAVYLLRSRRPAATVELYPKVGVREADFRIRMEGEPWTYVEVTKPDTSEAEERARTVLEGLAALAKPIKKSFALEVFLRREPTEEEEHLLRDRVPTFCALEGVQQEELANGMGLLLLNQSAPGQLVLQDHLGEESRPRIGMAKVIRGPDEPHRHIAVRMAFADERAEAFMTSEARQLPSDSPGLIIVQVAGAPGAMKSWEPLLVRRFQPNIHTRVGAVCLLSGGLLTTPRGEDWLPETKVLVNPYARLPIPAWIQDSLTDAGREFERVASGHAL